MQITISNLIWRIDKHDTIFQAWPIGYMKYTHKTDTYQKVLCLPTKAQLKLDPILSSNTMDRMIEKIESISDSIEQHTGTEWNVEAYYDYDEWVNPTDFVNFIKNHRDAFDTLTEALDEWHLYLMDHYYSYNDIAEYYYDPIISEWDLDNNDDANDIKNYFIENLWIFDFDYNFEHFDNDHIALNLYLLSPDEVNRDLWPVGEIASYYNNYKFKDINFNDECFDPENCFVAKLAKEQWFTMKQLLSPHKSYPNKLNKVKKESEFVSTMRDELANFFHVCWVFTVLEQRVIQDWINIFCVKGTKYLLHNGPRMWLFAPVVGWGSTLDVKLDWDILLETSYIYTVDHLDWPGAFGYTPRDVYGYGHGDYQE